MAGNPKKRAKRARQESEKDAEMARPLVNQACPAARARPRERPKRLVGSVMRTDWQDTFIAAFANSGNIKIALFNCEQQGVKVSRQTVTNERNRSESFRERYDQAEEESVEILEAEGRRRALADSDFLLWNLLKATGQRNILRNLHFNKRSTPMSIPRLNSRTMRSGIERYMKYWRRVDSLCRCMNGRKKSRKSRTVLMNKIRRSWNSTLRTRSKKAQAIAPKRRKFVESVLEDEPTCQVTWDDNCQRRSMDVHEPLTRARGGSILSRDNAVATCRHCHRQIHIHPNQATDRGFLISRWD